MQTIVVRATNGDHHLEGIRQAADILRSGGLVVFPTETVYGLGANAMDGDAVSRIFAAKGRPADNPLILHVSRLEQLAEVTTVVPDAAMMLIHRFWPGPLTIILPKTDSVPGEVTAGLDTVAIRMPDNDIALAFLEECAVPVAAPSANLSGRPSPTSLKDVIEDLDGRVDCIIDGGNCTIGIESTVVDLSRSTPVLLRPGAVTIEDLESILGRVDVDPCVLSGTPCDASTRPKSPGLKYRHYAPKAPVVLYEGDSDCRLSMLSDSIRQYSSQGKTVGVAALRETLSRLSKEKGTQLILKEMGSAADPSSIAAALFSVLRSLDRDHADIILVEGVDDTGVGFAVMNRLRKAAGGNIVKCQPKC